MRAAPVGAGAPDAAARPPAHGFRAVLARAAERGAGGAPTGGGAGARQPSAARHGAAELLRVLYVNRDRSRPVERSSSAAGPEGIAAQAARERDATAEPAPIAPAAVDRIALVARVQREGASVEMTLGPDLCVRVSRSGGGIELAMDATAHVARWAETELPRLVRALRERGIRVAGARVRRAAGPGRAALTPPRGSATTARSSAGGTVAKW